MASRRARSTNTIGSRLSDISQSVADLKAASRGTTTEDPLALIEALTARIELLESPNYRVEQDQASYPEPEDLSSYAVSLGGGTIYGFMAGRNRVLIGSGHTAVTSTGPVEIFAALPEEWRPPYNTWGSGYSAAYPVPVVLRPDGTGAVGNRISGTTLTTIQFTIPYMVQ